MLAGHQGQKAGCASRRRGGACSRAHRSVTTQHGCVTHGSYRRRLCVIAANADAAQAVQQDMASTSAPQQAAPAADSVPGTDRATSASASSSNRTSNLTDHANASPRLEAQLTLEQYKEVYDRLIKIFQERPRDDWKKLIVFSKQWKEHHKGVFDRVRELADKEDNVDKKMMYRRMLRTLQGVHDEVGRYNAMLAKFLSAGQEEWEAIVAVHRGDLHKPFFEHMQCLLALAKGDEERTEKLVAVNARLLALVANHDSIAADKGALESAADVYRDLLSSITSVEDADKRMADLSASGKIDPAFLQISAKAYGAARDTNMTLEEAKWVSYRLYIRARDYFERQQPVEKRILEYLITLRDPKQRSQELDAAVTPGPTRQTDSHDYMYTTPGRLFVILNETLKAFEAMQAQASSAMGADAASSTPRKVAAMRALRDEIVRRYL